MILAALLPLSRDIGVRYVLPVVALWLVVASAAATRLRSTPALVALVAAVGPGVPWSIAAAGRPGGVRRRGYPAGDPEDQQSPT
ncbi:MAG: hypothetical protein ACLP8S_09860 [Solirubrobacteraceae bacterium]